MMGDQSSGKQFSHNQDVLTLLNRDLANEMNTMLMYMANSLLVRGSDALDVKETAVKFAEQDFTHVQRLAERIVELDGTPELAPTQIDSNASIEMKTVSQHDRTCKPMLQNALENELQSVVEYKNQIQNIAFDDPATRLLLEEILADKEHQAVQIRVLLGA